MTTLKALKSRREGIEKINKITRAMQVIAATRLHRYEAGVSRFRPFVQAQTAIMNNLALRLKKINSLWTREPAAGQEGLVLLISSDRGFCGGFNNQLLQLINSLKTEGTFSFIAIGKKGAKYLKKQHFSLIEDSAVPSDTQLPDFLQRITEEVISAYRHRQQKIYLIFNQFRRNLLGRSFLKQLLPLEVKEEKGMVLDYLVEPEMEAMLDVVLPMYVREQIKAAILESKAAEEMARMVAMTQATRSAEDLIKSLTLQYHKARQAGITKELIEIVSAS